MSMTMEAFYQRLGGSYQSVLARIPSEAMIKRFAGAFEKDPSFRELCDAMEAGDRAAAFRAAHTLKGVCANLGFEALRQSAGVLTETLRAEADTIPAEALPQAEVVRRDYQAVVAAVSELISEG